MTSDTLDTNNLLNSGRWIEINLKKHKITMNGYTYYNHINIRIIDIDYIVFREIDNPHELRVAFDGNTHRLIKISIDVVNKSHMPLYLEHMYCKIMLLGDDGKKYGIFHDPHLLKWSKYSLTHQIRPDIECNPNIVYRSALVYSIPKEIQNYVVLYPDTNIRIL